MIDHWKLLRDQDEILASNIVLRRFRDSDAEDVFEYAKDPLTVKYLVWGGVKTIDEARTAISEFYQTNPGIYAIEVKATKKCIGCIDLRLVIEHEKASFGYVINRDYWGKGYGTEALNALVSFCFDILRLNRFESTHYIGNEGSGRVMEKCGLKLEGVLKEEVKIKGIFHDVCHYGVTRQEWELGLHREKI